MNLLTFTDRGIYCSVADVYIDPWKPVKNAFITHAHSDHATSGHQSYVSTSTSVPIIRHRLNPQKITGVEYGETIHAKGVKISFHPAGHIIGSAQIRLEYKGEVWVVSGDYKLENDGISTPFEPVSCHHFITESTFGLPAFNWEDQFTVYNQINNWWKQNKEKGKTSLLSVYALGKAQRIIHHLDYSIGHVFTHGAIENINEVLRASGLPIQNTSRVMTIGNKQSFEGALILATPGSIQSSWSKRFKDVSVGAASGWMNIRGMKRRRGVDKGFILSDHADWKGLISAIKETGAENIYVTHGYADIFSKYLNEKGWNASVVNTQFSGDLSNDTEQ